MSHVTLSTELKTMRDINLSQEQAVLEIAGMPVSCTPMCDDLIHPKGWEIKGLLRF